jgi:hypothetical protein
VDAACVMLKPNGSMHWRKTKPPGWGGFFTTPPWLVVREAFADGECAKRKFHRLLRGKDNMLPAFHSAQASTNMVAASTQ